MATVISMKALLESGVHFGHRTNKWHPLMKPYIFTERNGIHIIDLQQTVKTIGTAYNIVRDCVMEGGKVMFVGTKRQAQETVREEAVRCSMPYVTERWLPGTLTNWTTIYQRIQELERLEKMRDSGDINRLTKKEGLMIEREINRLTVRLSGIRMLVRPPDMLFVVDVMREATAVKEANIKNIPVIALVDTNCNPTGIDYIIPSNDDAIRAIKLLVGKVADAALEGKGMRKDVELEAEEAAGPQARPVSRQEAARTRDYAVEEMDESDLLGDATLAKLVGKARPDVAEEIVEEIAVEESLAVEETAVDESLVVEEIVADDSLVVDEAAAPPVEFEEVPAPVEKAPRKSSKKAAPAEEPPSEPAEEAPVKEETED